MLAVGGRPLAPPWLPPSSHPGTGFCAGLEPDLVTMLSKQPSPVQHFLRVPSTTPFDHVDQVVGNVAVGGVSEVNQIIASPDSDTARAVEAGQLLATVLGCEC